jgi:hypothetical protein
VKAAVQCPAPFTDPRWRSGGFRTANSSGAPGVNAGSRYRKQLARVTHQCRLEERRDARIGRVTVELATSIRSSHVADAQQVPEGASVRTLSRLRAYSAVRFAAHMGVSQKRIAH